MQLPQPKGGVSLITGRAPGKRARAGAAGRGRKVAELRQAGALQHRRQRRPARPRGRGGRGRGVAFGGGLRLPYLFDSKKKATPSARKYFESWKTDHALGQTVPTVICHHSLRVAR